MTPGLVRLMAAGAGLCVASNYFAQPLLALFAQAFGLTSTQAALLVTFAQLGYICGLLFVVPLGDLLERRRLLVTCTALSTVFLAAMGLAPGFHALLGVSVLLGSTTVAAQILVPLAAHMAPDATRGRVVSTVMSGLLIGILLARFAAGLIAEVAGWRAVYLLAAVLMAGFCWLCQRRLPRVEPTAKGSYPALLKTIVHLFLDEPVLRRRGLIGGLLFGAFAAFWTAMAFMLRESWHAGEAAIGAVALVGAIGAMSARFAGRLADWGWARVSTGVFVLLVVASWALLFLGTHSLVALIAGVVLLDLGLQGAHISNQSEVYRLDAKARSRLTTVYMSMYFSGGAVGSALTGPAYAQYGWAGACAIGAAMAVGALLVWAIGELRFPIASMRHG
ncbi:MFS transporter [Ramlibacter sp. G-1-2-2]|uniref:MFS transporter n=1 Tax=Ramlibacter agri TaxID=2728837 RepID=A0A848HER7_9BURK|nr:MFS transporter [Ramlibacter agri]NML47841.1 MFS transporter [Ramlibacter agri]